MSDQPKKVQGTFTSPEDKKWKTYFWEMQKGELKQYEEAAKFLIGIVSICITIFIKFDDKSWKNLPFKWVFYVGVFVWFLAILLAFLTWVPHSYNYAQENIASYKEAHKKMLKNKKGFFWSSFLLFYGGLIVFMVLFFGY